MLMMLCCAALTPRSELLNTHLELLLQSPPATRTVKLGMAPGLCRAPPHLSAVHLFHPLSLHLCRHSLLSTFLSRHEKTLAKLGGSKGNIPHLQSFGHAHFSPTSASPLMWSFPSLPRIAFDNLRKNVCCTRLLAESSKHKRFSPGWGAASCEATEQAAGDVFDGHTKIKNLFFNT